MRILDVMIAAQRVVIPGEQIEQVYRNAQAQPAEQIQSLAAALGWEVAPPRAAFAQHKSLIWGVEAVGQVVDLPLTHFYRLPRLLLQAAPPYVWALARLDNALCPVLNLDILRPIAPDG